MRSVPDVAKARHGVMQMNRRVVFFPKNFEIAPCLSCIRNLARLILHESDVLSYCCAWKQQGGQNRLEQPTELKERGNMFWRICHTEDIFNDKMPTCSCNWPLRAFIVSASVCFIRSVVPFMRDSTSWSADVAVLEHRVSFFLDLDPFFYILLQLYL